MSKNQTNNPLRNALEDAKANPGQTQKADMGGKTYSITKNEDGSVTTSRNEK